MDVLRVTENPNQVSWTPVESEKGLPPCVLLWVGDQAVFLMESDVRTMAEEAQELLKWFASGSN